MKTNQINFVKGFIFRLCIVFGSTFLSTLADASDAEGSKSLIQYYPTKVSTQSPQSSFSGFQIIKKYATSPVEVIIGTDDRVPSTDPSVGRIMPIGCTGWLISSGCILTAGHCAETPADQAKMQWFEFNVPASEYDGTARNSIPNNRYAIIPNSIVWGKQPNVSKGNDWCIFKVQPNAQTKLTVFEAQKTSGFRLIVDYSRFVPDKLTIPHPLFRVTGYGIDNQPPGSGDEENSKSQTEQTDSGPFNREDTTNLPKDIIYYAIDTNPANSGSPVFLVGTDMAVAIHTIGFSDNAPPAEKFNKGTGFKNTDLVSAIKSFPVQGVDLTYVDADCFATVTNGDGTLFNPYRRLEVAVAASASGKTLGITAGYYANGGISFPLGKKLILKALAGKVYIGGILPGSGATLPSINPPALAHLLPETVQHMSTQGEDIDDEDEQFEMASSSFSSKKEPIKRADIVLNERKLLGNPNDTRVLSNDPRVGRIVYKKNLTTTVLGTGFLISNGCIVTAGSVFITNDNKINSVLEMNIDKASSSAGVITRASAQNIYKVLPESIQIGSGNSGDSWTIFRVAPNTVTKKSVFESQRFSFRIMKDWYVDDNFVERNDLLFGTNPMVRVTGFGRSSSKTAIATTKNYIQQTDLVSISWQEDVSGNGDAIYYTLTSSQDVGLGSPMYFPGTHMVVGIKDVDGLTLKATGFKNINLVGKIKNCFQDNTTLIYVDSDYFAVLAKHSDGVTDGTGDVFAPYRNLEDAVGKSPTGSTLGIVAGYYANAGINFPLGKKLILKAISGKVYIGGILPQPGQQPPFGDTLTTEVLNHKNKKESVSVVPIEEPFAPTSSSSGDEDIFSSLGDFGLPIGSVLDWWNTNISNMPACFELCNGQRILDRESPLFGQYLPNLNHVFTRGTIDPQEVGQQGGHSKAVVSLKTSEDGAHRHQFSDNRGMTDLISRATTAQDIYMHERSAAASHNHGSWTHSQESGSSVSHRKGKGMNHRHSLPGTDSGGAHTHTITATVDISPPYVNVLKIMRIK